MTLPAASQSSRLQLIAPRGNGNTLRQQMTRRLTPRATYLGQFGHTQPRFIVVCDSLMAGSGASALHLDQLLHGHHIGVQISHDDHRSEHDKPDHENSERQRKKVIGLIRCA